ncbi:MAG: hypothetical protein EWM47_07755 [Anaerolineaceae bacterium]|nr:MAG: hypothetical protein EWM47_07755 [Anaerolineaceae bacterium]
MDEGNLLTGGVDKLNEIKENLLELRGYQDNYENLVIEEDKNEKSIQSLEKAASDEVGAIIKKRRTEIENAYDKQLDKTKASIKKIKDKRDKRKNKKVSERINEETASLQEENRRLKLEAKTLFKQKHVPSYCNTKLYYALYYPRYFSDMAIILFALLLTLLIIPCGIYFFILPEERIFYLVLIYIITVVIFGGLYLLIGNHTKDKHSDILKQIRELRHDIINNKKKIKVIKRNIKKDRDESAYGLENFDVDLEKLDSEAAEIAEQKKEALLTFENTTTQVITSEIRKQYEEKITNLKVDNDTIIAKSAQAESKIKALTLKIASEYEPFIGKDLITLDRIESLINIIEAGNASNISEAVQFYRQNMV